MNGTYYKTNDQVVFQVIIRSSKSIDAWNNIVVSASYLKIEGFEIEGDNATLTLADGAKAEPVI